MSETGVIKFRCEHAVLALAPFTGFEELNACRCKLRALGLMGVDGNRVGFGNMSVRDGLTNRFYITGSATGAKEELALDDCARVVAYDFAANWLKCEGTTVASSESLTHAAVYECTEGAGAVIHGHSRRLWTDLRDQVPTASAGIEYGTPAMALEVKRMFNATALRTEKIFLMAGHPDGVVAFGRDLSEAFGILASRLAAAEN